MTVRERMTDGRLLRATLFGFLALSTGCSGDSGTNGDSSGEKTNLILISLDTCRADRLSCYGAERENTPELDRFASGSVQFEDCLSQSCVTAPAHLSMLTGHYVHRHGLKKNGLESLPPYSIASQLGDHGWKTAAFTGHGSFQAKYGHGKGFETFQSWTGPDKWPFTRNIHEVVPHALEWLDANQEDPFFLMVHGYDPHCPYWPEDPVRSEYAGWYEGKLLPERICGPPQFLNLIQRGRIGAEELRYISDLYDAELFLADQALGDFFDELERRGLFENTIVVFTSDRVLLADEPTGNLDSATGERVLELLFEEQERRKLSMILVTHDDRLAERCERVLMMEDGLIQADSTVPIPD